MQISQFLIKTWWTRYGTGLSLLRKRGTCHLPGCTSKESVFRMKCKDCLCCESKRNCLLEFHTNSHNFFSSSSKLFFFYMLKKKKKRQNLCFNSWTILIRDDNNIIAWNELTTKCVARVSISYFISIRQMRKTWREKKAEVPESFIVTDNNTHLQGRFTWSAMAYDRMTIRSKNEYIIEGHFEKKKKEMSVWIQTCRFSYARWSRENGQIIKGMLQPLPRKIWERN